MIAIILILQIMYTCCRCCVLCVHVTDAVTDMQESIINEEQAQDNSVQEQQNPGWCIIDIYNIAHNNITYYSCECPAFKSAIQNRFIIKFFDHARENQVEGGNIFWS